MSDTLQHYEEELKKLEPNSFEKKFVLLFTSKAKVFKWYNSDYEFRSGLSWLNDLELEEDESILYGMGLNQMKGFMLFAFANGKVAKIHMKAYETKTERKILMNAYNDESPLIFLKYIEEDIDILIKGSTEKVLIINTSIINPLDTKSSRGVQILKLKPSTHATQVYLMDEVNLQEPAYYKREGAAVGYYLKPGDELGKKMESIDNETV